VDATAARAAAPTAWTTSACTIHPAAAAGSALPKRVHSHIQRSRVSGARPTHGCTRERTGHRQCGYVRPRGGAAARLARPGPLRRARSRATQQGRGPQAPRVAAATLSAPAAAHPPPPTAIAAVATPPRTPGTALHKAPLPLCCQSPYACARTGERERGREREIGRCPAMRMCITGGEAYTPKARKSDISWSSRVARWALAHRLGSAASCAARKCAAAAAACLCARPARDVPSAAPSLGQSGPG
jgi:hypothetical protein